MSDPRKSFVELALDGQVDLEEIDDFVDRWHNEPDGDLQAYLGMTQEEYALWLARPDMLPHILRARRHQSPLKIVVGSR